MTLPPELLSLGGAIVGTLVVGTLKKPIESVNATVRNTIKPVQPLIVLGLSWALPQLGAAVGLGDMGPPEAWVNAPLSTLLAVTGREVISRVKGAKK